MIFQRIAPKAALPAALAALSLFNAEAAEYVLLDRSAASGRIEAVLSTDADAISLGRDTTATLTLRAPEQARAALPDPDAMRGRFQGFSIAEGYVREPVPLPDSRIESSIRWRLRADPAAPRYRLAPFAIGAPGADPDGFATVPVLFPLKSLPAAEGGVEIAPAKYFVWPDARTVGRWLLLVLAACAVAVVLALAVRRIHREVRVRLMSPAERAFHELGLLLGRGLAERGLFKDYYIELTHVVRRYVERAYGIRAPRQTTDEFLASAKDDSRFAQEAIAELSSFLRSADMVKFAGMSATCEMAGEAARAARRYIENDAALAAARAADGKDQRRP